MKKVVPNRLRLGLPLPKAIQEAPTLRPELAFYMEAFHDLATCRGGMGDGPIPWTAVKCYADHHQFDQESSDDLWWMVQRLDQAWMENRQ